MNLTKAHRVLGLILLLPLLGWITTGFVFLIQPGYAGAYEQLSPKLYPLDKSSIITPQNTWTEVRLVHTILGQHLLVRANGQWQHLDPKSQKLQPPPNAEQLALLLSDAISVNAERYGHIENRAGEFYVTSTDIKLSVNWNTLTIHQEGNDTRLINALYKIHYLQWLPHSTGNTIMGALGLLLLALLVCFGIVSYLGRRQRLIAIRKNPARIISTLNR